MFSFTEVIKLKFNTESLCALHQSKVNADSPDSFPYYDVVHVLFKNPSFWKNKNYIYIYIECSVNLIFALYHTEVIVSKRLKLLHVVDYLLKKPTFLSSLLKKKSNKPFSNIKMKKVKADFLDIFLEYVLQTTSCLCYYAKTLQTYTFLTFI